MRKKNYLILKGLVVLMIATFTFLMASSNSTKTPIIIDHYCTDINKIPPQWIEKAKSEFRIFYAHSSHGSQIVSGMEVLSDKSDLYSFNKKGKKVALSFHDQKRYGDLGNPNRTEWYYKTRKLLESSKNDRNVVMWSWCGQVSHSSQENIETYLNLMNKLEDDYPNIIFIYMTGHLDGSGEEGTLHRRNNQIREFCRKNNKVLFDFADIESYDPNGNYFLNKGADDGCNYKENGVIKNWAEKWCKAHPQECPSCKCAHSHPLNCLLKGRAFWWMMARLAGWAGPNDKEKIRNLN